MSGKSTKLRWIYTRYNALIGAVLILVLICMAIISSFYTPYDPLKLDFHARLQSPSAQHFLGTDQLGRDVFSRVLTASGVTAMISIMTVLFASTFGTLIGAVSGYIGGRLDRTVMILMDALLAFPGILLALGIMAVIGPSQYGIVIALGLAYLPGVVRVIRGTVLSIREKEFIEASMVTGNSELYTVLRHVIPNCITPLTVISTAMFGGALLSESALSFLGLGVPPPAPTWGGMLADGREFMDSAPWLSIFPGLAISLALLGINLFGDALRDKFDPRMNQL
jgi:peptide/nickel transport system permease protein